LVLLGWAAQIWLSQEIHLPAHTFKVAGLTNLGQNGLDVSEPRCAICYIDCTIVQICAIDGIAGKQRVIY